MKKIILSPLCTASVCLSVTLLAAGLAAQIAAALVPNIILPRTDVTLLAGLSLAALAAEAVIFGAGSRSWIGSLLVAVLVFGLLPWCAGLSGDPLTAVKTGALGGVVFLVCETLYCSMLDRLSSGPVKYQKPMAVAAAALLWLACQALMGVGL